MKRIGCGLKKGIRAMGVGLALLGFLLFLAYTLHPDCLAALTLLPAWSWLLLPAAFMLLRVPLGRWGLLAVWLVWGVFFFTQVEEFWSIGRGCLSPVCQQKKADDLRFVSVNCSGNPGVLHELRLLQPDVVFLQESPGAQQVQQMAQELFGCQGCSVYGPDCSIIAKHALRAPGKGQRYLFLTMAEATLPGIGPVGLGSLRLRVGRARLDLWNPACWVAQAEVRRQHIEQVQQIAGAIMDYAAIVIGGDFNAPPRDRCLRYLPARLRDCFAMEGRGVGNTVLQDFPVLRIDQIWASTNFCGRQAFAVKSRQTDHRMVVADLRPNK